MIRSDFFIFKKPWMFRKPFVQIGFVLFFLLFSATGFCANSCNDFFESFSKANRLEQGQFEGFVRDVVSQAVDGRFFFSAENKVRSCSQNGNCLDVDFSLEGAKNVRFIFDDRLEKPRIEVTDQAHILSMPRDYNLVNEKIIRRLLVGHPMHPFIISKEIVAKKKELGIPALRLKDVQKEAIAVMNAIMDSGGREFLFVAPTGTGKTEVLKELLTRQVQKKDAQNIHLLIANRTMLTDQLLGDMMSLRHENVQFKKWGGSLEKFNEDSIDYDYRSIEGLVAEAEKSSDQVVVVTTIQTLLSGVGEASAANLSRFLSRIGTVVFDEVHHSGARLTLPFLYQVKSENPKAFLYGTTATPMHRRDHFRDLFNNQIFYAYLDNRAEFFNGEPKVRDIPEVVDQLYMAINQGELSPFDMHFVSPKIKLEENEEADLIHGNDGKGLYVIKEEYMFSVARAFSGAIRRNKYGFISASTINEAVMITAYFSEYFRRKGDDIKFAVLHSDLPPKEQKKVKDLFVERKINYLVTVNQLDEGVNYPWMSLYIDTSPTIHPRRLVQRLGRVLRLDVGKERAEVMTFLDMNDDNLKSDFEFYNRLGYQETEVDGPRIGAEPRGGEIEIIEMNEFFVGLQKTEFWQRRKNKAMNPFIIEGIGKTAREKLFSALSHWFVHLDKLRPDIAIRGPKSEGEDVIEGERTFYQRLFAGGIKASDLSDPELIKNLTPEAQEVLQRRLGNDPNLFIVKGIGKTAKEKGYSALSHWIVQIDKLRPDLAIRWPKGRGLIEGEGTFYKRLFAEGIKASDLSDPELIKNLTPEAKAVLQRRVLGNDPNRFVVEGIGKTAREKLYSALSHWIVQLDKLRPDLAMRGPRKEEKDLIEGERAFYRRLLKEGIKVTDLSEPELIKNLTPEAQEVLQRRLGNDPNRFVVEGFGKTAREKLFSAISHWFVQLDKLRPDIAIRGPKGKGKDLIEGESAFYQKLLAEGIKVSDLTDPELIKNLTLEAKEVLQRRFGNDPNRFVVEGIGKTAREKLYSALSHWIVQLDKLRPDLAMRGPKRKEKDLIEGEGAFNSRFYREGIKASDLSDPELIKNLTPEAQEVLQRRLPK